MHIWSSHSSAIPSSSLGGLEDSVMYQSATNDVCAGAKEHILQAELSPNN